MKSRNKNRADDKTTLSVSLPKVLKHELQAAADAQNRSLSNYIVTAATEWLRAQRIAEQAPSYVAGPLSLQANSPAPRRPNAAG